MELPRVKPWMQLSSRPGKRLPVIGRDTRSVLRWPAARVARAGLLAIVAGGSLRAAWAGAVPLVVGAGVALFIAGLDAVEPLAQEVDHPTRRDSAPVEAGALYVRHIPVAVLVLVGVAALAGVAAALPGPGQVPAGVAAIVAVAAAFGAAGGALVSLIGGEVTVQGESWNLLPPEVAGMRLAVRSALPPFIAIAGTLPVLAARAAQRNGQPPVGAAAAAAAAVGLLFALVTGWVRVRDQLHEWWRAQMKQAFPQSGQNEEPTGA
jgi:hypothetical protein